MKNPGRILIALVLVIALLMGTALAEAEKPVKAYFVTIVSGGVAWGAAEKGFMDACADLGWDG